MGSDDGGSRAERTGRKLADELEHAVISQFWPAGRHLILDVSVSCLDAHPDASAAPEVSAALHQRAEQIARSLLERQVEAISAQGLSPDDERRAIDRCRQAHAQRGPPISPEEASRAGRVGRELATQLTRAVSQGAFSASDERVIIASAARHLRLHLRRYTRMTPR